MDFTHLFEEIKGPEFWMSVGFFAVVFLAYRPTKEYLAKWGNARAARIQKSLDDPANLKKQAQELLTQYENYTHNRESERQAILKEADNEIIALQKENKLRLTERMERKHNEMTGRLQTIEENGVKQLKDQMVHVIVNRTHDLLKKQQSTVNQSAEMDKALAQVFHSLTENQDLIKRD